MPASKDSKSKTWRAQFYYTDGQGTRRKICKRGFKTKKDAEAWERDYLSRRHFGKDMTFGAVCDLWFEDNQNKLKPSTLRNAENVIEYALKPWLNKRMEDIDERAIITLQNDLMRRGLKPSTVHKYESITRALYHYGARLCGVTRDPFKNIKKAGKPSSTRKTFWTIDQYKDFRATLDPERGTPFDVLFYTGVRIGELMALTIDDIDLSKKLIHVNKTFDWAGGEEESHEPKTEKSNRDITLPPPLVDELRDYISKLYRPDGDTRVFWLAHQTYRDTLRRYCTSHPDVPSITIHDLRHSHVAMLRNIGKDWLAISERLGHSSVAFTMSEYGHLYPDEQEDIADALGELMR